MLIIHGNARAFDSETGTWAPLADTRCYWNNFIRNTSATIGDRLEYKVTLEAGTYDVLVTYTRGTSGGIADFYIDVTLIGSINMYNSSTQYGQYHTFSSITIPTTGEHTFTIESNQAKQVYLETFTFQQTAGTTDVLNPGSAILCPTLTPITIGQGPIQSVGHNDSSALANRVFRRGWWNASDRQDGDNFSIAVSLNPGTYTMRVFYPIFSTVGAYVQVYWNGSLIETLNQKSPGATDNTFYTTITSLTGLASNTLKFQVNGYASGGDHFMDISGIALWRTA